MCAIVVRHTGNYNKPRFSMARKDNGNSRSRMVMVPRSGSSSPSGDSGTGERDIHGISGRTPVESGFSGLHGAGSGKSSPKKKEWKRKPGGGTGPTRPRGSKADSAMTASLMLDLEKSRGIADGLSEKIAEMKELASKPKPVSWVDLKKTIPNSRLVNPKDFTTGSKSVLRFWDREEYEHLEMFTRETDADLRLEADRMSEHEYKPMYQRVAHGWWTIWGHREEILTISVELAAQLMGPRVVSLTADPETVKAKMGYCLQTQSKIHIDKYLSMEGRNVYADTLQYAWAKYTHLIENLNTDFRSPQRRQLGWPMGFVLGMLCFLILTLWQISVVCSTFRPSTNSVETPSELVLDVMRSVWLSLNQTYRTH